MTHLLFLLDNVGLRTCTLIYSSLSVSNVKRSLVFSCNGGRFSLLNDTVQLKTHIRSPSICCQWRFPLEASGLFYIFNSTFPHYIEDDHNTVDQEVHVGGGQPAARPSGDLNHIRVAQDFCAKTSCNIQKISSGLLTVLA